MALTLSAPVITGPGSPGTATITGPLMVGYPVVVGDTFSIVASNDLSVVWSIYHNSTLLDTETSDSTGFTFYESSTGRTYSLTGATYTYGQTYTFTVDAATVTPTFVFNCDGTATLGITYTPDPGYTAYYSLTYNGIVNPQHTNNFIVSSLGVYSLQLCEYLTGSIPSCQVNVSPPYVFTITSLPNTTLLTNFSTCVYASPIDLSYAGQFSVAGDTITQTTGTGLESTPYPSTFNSYIAGVSTNVIRYNLYETATSQRQGSNTIVTYTASCTKSITITVSASTLPGTINNVIVCVGSSGSLNIIGNEGSILNWRSSIDNGITWITITNTSTTLNYTNIQQTTLYVAQVQNGTCLPSYTNIATITVTPQGLGGSLNLVPETCSSMNTGELVISGWKGTILYWQQSVDGGITWTTIPNTIGKVSYYFMAISETTLYRVAIKSGGCPIIYSLAYAVTIKPCDTYTCPVPFCEQEIDLNCVLWLGNNISGSIQTNDTLVQILIGGYLIG